VTVVTDVPEELLYRGISPPQYATGFAISLDTAEPWGGGRFEGRVERRGGRHAERVVSVLVRCDAAWLDVAPQLVGRKRFLSLSTYWDIRTRSVPIWLDHELFVTREELGALAEANWLPFTFAVPGELPRAVEGTFIAFRWRIEAFRRRRLGLERTSLPILLHEPRSLPVVRVETSPLGSWRLLEWRSEEERDDSAGPCTVAYAERRPEDMPAPGETREEEQRRRLTG
jgi:hypothetical protein